MNRFYFDHNATTPVAPEVFEAHLAALRDLYGNASSIHQTGQEARRHLEEARGRVARLLHTDPKQLTFVSGGTEADNLILFGAVAGAEKAHVITTAIEHPAVLQPCAELQRRGHEVTYLPIGRSGVLDPDEVSRALRPHTRLVSVMHVNNEIGTVQPLKEIAAIAREAGVPMHSDGVQAPGRVDVDLREIGLDFYTVSGHKMCAPKGTGVLFVRDERTLRPMLFGGRHERGLRPGTENVPGAVALGVAAESIRKRSPEEMQRTAEMRDSFEQQIRVAIPDITINGERSARSPNTSNICFHGIEGEAVVIALDLRGFSVSSGAACSSGAVEPSHVLTAIGLSRREAKSCVRFSFGLSNTAEQTQALATAVVDVVARLRRISTDYAAHA